MEEMQRKKEKKRREIRKVKSRSVAFLPDMPDFLERQNELQETPQIHNLCDKKDRNRTQLNRMSLPFRFCIFFVLFITNIFSDEGISMNAEVLSNFSEKQIEDMEFQRNIKRNRRTRKTIKKLEKPDKNFFGLEISMV